MVSDKRCTLPLGNFKPPRGMTCRRKKVYASLPNSTSVSNGNSRSNSPLCLTRKWGVVRSEESQYSYSTVSYPFAFHT